MADGQDIPESITDLVTLGILECRWRSEDGDTYTLANLQMDLLNVDERRSAWGKQQARTESGELTISRMVDK